MGGTAAELAELTKLCEEKGLQWMDGTMWYHSIRTKEIEKKLRNGDLGQVQCVCSHAFEPGCVPIQLVVVIVLSRINP